MLSCYHTCNCYKNKCELMTMRLSKANGDETNLNHIVIHYLREVGARIHRRTYKVSSPFPIKSLPPFQHALECFNYCHLEHFRCELQHRLNYQMICLCHRKECTGISPLTNSLISLCFSCVSSSIQL